MKLFVGCNQCSQEFIDSGGKNLLLLSYAKLTIADDGIYEFECRKGHKSVTTLSAERFEVLYEIGANAIIDGYYREAVSSFSSSLERFYEYFLNIVSISKCTPEDKFINAWKSISNQSERQVGAFVFTWLFETGNPPSQLNDKWKGFRNNVIHKGVIPSETDAIMYGSEVLKLLHEGIALIRSNYEKQRETAMGRAAMKFPKEKYSSHVVGGMGISTIISLSNFNPSHTLQDGLDKLKGQRITLNAIEKAGLTSP